MRRGKWTEKYRRIAAACMAAVTFSAGLVSPVQAAAPKVSVDETLYVNLDYYGNETLANVVKGCSTNGVTNYTDYGVYDKVVNMSDKTEPVIGDGTVSWQFPAENKRFYYQGTLPKNSAKFPWNFDVSYKLNGVEADAAKLAGASGLVEIHIKATPGKEANPYYRDNMLLSVAVPVDMEKCYSVDAPGSQLQSIGNNTVAVFAALPGEEGDYTVRIGTDSFENVGVIMTMIPGTLDALSSIKDLKEAKNTWRTEGDNMYDSMNQLMKTMESMKSDVTQVKGGVDSLEHARAKVSQNRKAIESLSTQAIADLSLATEQTATVISYLDTAKQAVTDINNNVTAISLTMADAQDELDKLYDRLGSLRRSLESTSQKIGEGITPDEQQALTSDITQTTEEIQGILSALGPILSGGKSVYDLTEEELTELSESLATADAFRYDRKKTVAGDEDSEAGAGAQEGPSGLVGSGGVNDADFEMWRDEELEGSASETEEALQALLGTEYQASVGDALGQIGQLLGDGEDLQEQAGSIIQKVNTLSAAIGSTGHQTAQTISSLRGVTDELVNMLDDSRVLIDTMDSYVPTLLNCLGDTEELMNRLTRAMGSTHDMLNLVNQTMIAAGDSLDAGTKDSLNGLSAMLHKSLGMLDNITGVRTASEGMKDTLDEQLDKFEEENQFLNLDPEAEMVSFTSSKNPSPRSLQIIVRTDEISLDNGISEETDLEASSAKVELSPLARMWNVLVEIVNSIVRIFKNR